MSPLHVSARSVRSTARRSVQIFAIGICPLVIEAGAAPRLVEAPRFPEVGTVACPPGFADTVHVPRGCFLSTVTYLARFCARHRDETGLPVSVCEESHTLALISWRGEWWARDEYAGVFRLRLSTSVSPNTDALRARLEARFAQLTARQVRSGLIPSAREQDIALSEAEARAAVRAAAKMIPFTSHIYRVRAGPRTTDVLFFCPANDQVAVYMPTAGTLCAACKAGDTAVIVAAAARHAGLAVSSLTDVASVAPDAPSPGSDPSANWVATN